MNISKMVPRVLLGLVLLGLVLLGCSDEGKRTVNEPCQNNTDCADEICHRGVCASSSPRSNASPCAGPGHCRSFTCENGVCQPGRLSEGNACRYDEECAGNRCQGGQCAKGLAPDSSGPDSQIDGGHDAGAPDTVIQDLPLPDAPAPEASLPDTVIPDLPLPDAPLPDAPTSDAPLPDAPTSDAPLPDAPTPDLLLPDMFMPDAPMPDAPLPDTLAPDSGGGYSVWKQLTIPTDFRIHCMAAQGKVILIAGTIKVSGVTSGSVYRSDDGGQTWKPALGGYASSNIQDVSLDGTEAAAIDVYGRIWTSNDTGASFGLVKQCWTLGMPGGVAVHKGHVLAAGRNFICWSTKLAGPFTVQDARTINPSSPHAAKATVKIAALTTVTSTAKITGLVMGSGSTNYLFRNEGMGSTWTDRSKDFSASITYAPVDVTLSATGQAFALDSSGTIHRSTDGGKTWSHNAVAGGYKTYVVVHDPAATPPGHVLVSGETTHLSFNGGSIFTPLIIPKLGGRFSAAAFNGAGKAYLGQRYPPSGTSALLESRW